MLLSDRCAGSLLALALADAMGARHEGGAIGAAVWWAVGGHRGGQLRWTDDTQMALALAQSLAARGGLDEDHVAARWAEECDWKRGYGGGARKLLAAIADGADWREANRRFFPDGSWGNGAAMRAAPVGLYFHHDPDACDDAARRQSKITHAHPIGIEGGRLIAAATARAVRDENALALESDIPEHADKLARAREMFDATPRDVARALGNGVAAHDSVVTALYVADRFADAPFEDMMAFVVAVGGDTDTIGAMAGGIWGAHRGPAALPADKLALLEARDTIEAAARALTEP